MKILKFFIILSLVPLFVLLLVYISQNYQCQSCQNYIAKEKNNQVCLNDVCFQVEIADNAFERARGLMFRSNLPQNSGMLFIFEEEGIYPFWMKNTLIPLDIIWLNKDKRIVFFKKNAQPCGTDICLSIDPEQEARYVLEINNGLVEKYKIKLGDFLFFN